MWIAPAVLRWVSLFQNKFLLSIDQRIECRAMACLASSWGSNVDIVCWWTRHACPLSTIFTLHVRFERMSNVTPGNSSFASRNWFEFLIFFSPPPLCAAVFIARCGGRALFAFFLWSFFQAVLAMPPKMLSLVAIFPFLPSGSTFRLGPGAGRIKYIEILQSVG